MRLLLLEDDAILGEGLRDYLRGEGHVVDWFGSLRALQMAVDAGADAVYLGLRDATNARNFAGLNFDDAQVHDGVAYAHARGREVLMALNTYADALDPTPWFRAVDRAAALLAVAAVATMAIPLLPMVNQRLFAVPNGIAMIGLGWSLWRDRI